MPKKEIRIAIKPGSLDHKSIVGYVRFADNLELQGVVFDGKYYHKRFNLFKPVRIGQEDESAGEVWVIANMGLPGERSFTGYVEAKSREEFLRKVNEHYHPIEFEFSKKHLLLSKDGEFWFFCVKAEEIK